MNRPTQTQTKTAGPSAGTTPGQAQTVQPPAIVPGSTKGTGLIAKFGAKYGVDPDKVLSTLKNTVFKCQKQKDGTIVEATNEQLQVLLIVADQYGLNPFTREIYAFPDKKNGIIPVVGVDGWLRIINQHPQFRSMEFRDSEEMIRAENGEHPGAPAWIEVTITRADRDKPTVIREYFNECYRPPFKGRGQNGDYEVAGPWQTHPARFLRHKAIIQCGRVAFGFVGIFDPDEAERIAKANSIDSTAQDVTGRAAPTPKPITREPQAKIAAPVTPAAEPQQASMLPDEATPAQTITALLDRTGIPETSLLAHFEIGDRAELTPAMELQAIEWLRANAP
jgi:phage recombination protein Bet